MEDKTYRRLRKAIGYLGIALPIVLILLSYISETYVTKQPSISHYYYTNLRDIFTGILCAVGLFLIRYKGFGNDKWWLNDNLLTNVAGAMALGVALVPTDFLNKYDQKYTPTLLPFEHLNLLHYSFASILFLIFAQLSIKVFTIGHVESKAVMPSIINENSIYKTCGFLILIFILLIPICSKLEFEYSTLYLEALSLVSFGISWLVKGRFLGDKGKLGLQIYGEHFSHENHGNE